MNFNNPAPSPPSTPAKTKAGAFVPALMALVLPIAAFVVSWAIAGKIPMAVPKAEWGTWFVIGAVMGIAGVAGLVFAIRALARGGYRSMAAAGLVLNIALVLVAWAGLFA